MAAVDFGYIGEYRKGYEWIAVRAIEVNGGNLVKYRKTQKGWIVYYLPHKWHYVSVPFCILSKTEILTKGITAGPWMAKVVYDKRKSGDAGIRVYLYPYPVRTMLPKLVINIYDSFDIPESDRIENVVYNPSVIYTGLNGREERDFYYYVVKVV